MAAQLPSHATPSAAGTAAAATAPRSSAILRYLDVVLVIIAVPVSLALKAPAAGIIVSAGAWLLQRADLLILNGDKLGGNRFFQTNVFSDFRRFTTETNVHFDDDPPL